MNNNQTDWRALCAELHYWVIELTASHPNLSESGIAKLNEITDRTFAALSQPDPQVPTDEDLNTMLYYEFTTSTGHGERSDPIGFARAVLARWGK